MKKHPCIISNSTICQSYKYRFPYDLIYHANFKKMNFQAKNFTNKKNDGFGYDWRLVYRKTNIRI